jgi:hypothetical protein
VTRNFYRKQIAQLVGVMLLAPILFLLAGGPLLRYSLHHPTAAKAISFLYDPVFRVFDVTPFERPWVRYLDWWGVEVLDVGDNAIQKPWYLPGR